jgi:TRAP-type C4-dicarboxylate transport system substrate-binding protein
MNHSLMARVFNKFVQMAGIGLLATSTFAQAQTLDFASVFPESDFSSLMVKHWTEGVTKATDGRIKFRIHWSGSLVGNKMVDALRDGVVDAALLTARGRSLTSLPIDFYCALEYNEYRVRSDGVLL